MAPAQVPYDPLPTLVHAAQATHGENPRQAWRVEGLWGMHLYRYSADLTVSGQRYRIEPGSAGFTPPGTLAAYRFEGRSTHLYAHLDFPQGALTRLLPLVFPAGPTFGTLLGQMEEVIALLATQPRRAQIKAWDIWYSLQEIALAPGAALPEAVRRALDLIEARLHEPLTVGEIADELAVSHNHLTRLFRVSTGRTVIETICQRRTERARHLLERSTMPVKEIASLVGIEDLQLFNKTIRRTFGQSPRALRRGA